ncbi:hypothetical protein [Pseudoalteromonas sp. NZS11]|nr:hypothetical protein [Pseudoalteromonas sp. NZS11]MBH0078167.1 hypothetical protein [Pseudoalteromonas sp. NZS11]
MLTQFDKHVKAALLVRQQARRLHGHYTEGENTRRREACSRKLINA